MSKRSVAREPAWLNRLRSSARLSTMGIQWYDDEAAQAVEANLRQGTPGIPDRDPEGSARAREAMRIVARGPHFTLVAGSEDKGFEPTWWVARDRPSQLHLALSFDAPPHLWIPAGADEKSVEGTWNAVLREDIEDNRHRTHLFSCFGGALRDAPFGFYSLEDWCVTSPFTNGFPYLLGTAVPMGSSEGDMYDEPSHTSRFMTAFSRTMIEFTGHHRVLQGSTILFLEIAYAPAPHAAVIEGHNKRFASSWPLDMPVDVLCTMGHTLGKSAAGIRAEVEADPEAGSAALMLLAELTLLDEEGRAARLAALRSHPSTSLRHAAIRGAFMIGEREVLATFAHDQDAAVADLARALLAELDAQAPKKRPARPSGSKAKKSKKSTPKKSTPKKSTPKKSTPRRVGSKKKR